MNIVIIVIMIIILSAIIIRTRLCLLNWRTVWLIILLKQSIGSQNTTHTRYYHYHYLKNTNSSNNVDDCSFLQFSALKFGQLCGIFYKISIVMSKMCVWKSQKVGKSNETINKTLRTMSITTKFNDKLENKKKERE